MSDWNPCSWCKRERTDEQWWHETSNYTDGLRITKTYCPSCWSLVQRKGIKQELKDRIADEIGVENAKRIIQIIEEME